MRTALPFHKGRKNILIRTFFLFGRVFHVFGKYHTPSRFQDLLTGDFKFYFIHFAHYGGSRNLTVGIEHSYKTASYQIIDTTLHIGQVLSINSGRDDGMVVRHLRVIEYLFRLWQCNAIQRSCQNFIITKSFQDAGTFRINIITQESGIDTRIGGNFLFIKRLDQFQCLIGRVSKLLIALHLKGSQVEQTRGVFLAVFFTDAGHYER